MRSIPKGRHRTRRRVFDWKSQARSRSQRGGVTVLRQVRRRKSKASAALATRRARPRLATNASTLQGRRFLAHPPDPSALRDGASKEEERDEHRAAELDGFRGPPRRARRSLEDSGRSLGRAQWVPPHHEPQRRRHGSRPRVKCCPGEPRGSRPFQCGCGAGCEASRRAGPQSTAGPRSGIPSAFPIATRRWRRSPIRKPGKGERRAGETPRARPRPCGRPRLPDAPTPTHGLAARRRPSPEGVQGTQLAHETLPSSPRPDEPPRRRTGPYVAPRSRLPLCPTRGRAALRKRHPRGGASKTRGMASSPHVPPG